MSCAVSYLKLLPLPGASGGPSLATDPVALVAGPLHAVLASSSVGVADGARAIGPEGVVVAVAGASLAGRQRLPLDELARLGGGSREDASDGGQSEEQRAEGDHGGCCLCWC